MLLNTIHNEDCLQLLKRIADNTIDLTITSPPYNLGEKHHTGNNVFNAYDEYKDDLPEAAARIKGITIERWHFFGDQICIARGALEDPIQSTAKLVLELHKQMREHGMLKGA